MTIPTIIQEREKELFRNFLEVEPSRIAATYQELEDFHRESIRLVLEEVKKWIVDAEVDRYRYEGTEFINCEVVMNYLSSALEEVKEK